MRARVLRYVAIIIGVFVAWMALLFLAGAVMESRVPVNLPYFSGITPIMDGYVKATGTWVIDGDQQGFPLQTTEISCERDLKRCTSATAQVMLGKQLSVHLDVYDIVSWEKSRIVFVDDSPTCVSYVFTMDLASKSVAGVRRKKPSEDEKQSACTTFDKELRLYLRQGTEVTKRLQDDAVPWFGHIVFAPFKLLN
jgi:hypothetical protein